jgi:hypothetical protein
VESDSSASGIKPRTALGRAPLDEPVNVPTELWKVGPFGKSQPSESTVEQRPSISASRETKMPELQPWWDENEDRASRRLC